jgi:flavin reductase (DIM6/NTAB) family NADH-FMN oxidoreductase RutF
MHVLGCRNRRASIILQACDAPFPGGGHGHLLRRDQVALSAAFSGALPPETRFGLGEWAVSPEGISYLENAQINIFCRKAAAVPYGTHTIFIGEVELVNVHDPVDPLIYQDATYCFSVPAEIKTA